MSANAIGIPQLMFGKVMHKRLVPKMNAFTYDMFYMVCPLSKLVVMPMKLNRLGIFSFYNKDHGPRDGGDLEKWIKGILQSRNVPQADGEVILVTLPRVLGYVFNPVSFWFCCDKLGGLRAVLCEVSNTFGEYHNYMCAHADRRIIAREDWLIGEKFFHVSPFLHVEGTYRFRFHMDDRLFGAWIDHSDESGQKRLITSLCGQLKPMTGDSLRYAFWRYPLVTFKAVALIHWQALKLLVKGVRYISKPIQKNPNITDVANITKM